MEKKNDIQCFTTDHNRLTKNYESIIFTKIKLGITLIINKQLVQTGNAFSNRFHLIFIRLHSFEIKYIFYIILITYIMLLYLNISKAKIV